MNNFPHTWDGRNITASATGWSEYTTDKDPTTTSPPPALSIQDVLGQIRQVRQILTQPKVDKALRDLYAHMAEHGNPHHTDLDMFTKEVVDVLYEEYVRQGGTGNKDFYVQSLFYTLRVASLEEMANSTDENLLVSVKGAHRVIEDHERDLHAHADLFEQWFPGEPVAADPIIALNPAFGMLPQYLYIRRPEGETPNPELDAPDEIPPLSPEDQELIDPQFGQIVDPDPIDPDFGVDPENRPRPPEPEVIDPDMSVTPPPEPPPILPPVPGPGPGEPLPPDPLPQPPQPPQPPVPEPEDPHKLPYEPNTDPDMDKDFGITRPTPDPEIMPPPKPNGGGPGVMSRVVAQEPDGLDDAVVLSRKKGGKDKTDSVPMTELVNIASRVNRRQSYTIIDRTGRLVTLPLNQGVNGDWALCQPLFPCFGNYTNQFRHSTKIEDKLLYRRNVGYRDAPDIVAPDGTKGDVVEVYTTDDYIPVDHSLVRRDFTLPIGSTKTVSLFVKPAACKYLAIRFTDMVAADLEAQAIFNLEDNAVVMMNNLGRYTAEIHRLSNGWRRCCFTMSHDIGQKSDLLFTFFNMDTSDILTSFEYKAVTSVVGYVWGAQLEDKPSASPYVPTEDHPIAKRGHYYLVDIEDKFDVNDMTISIQFRNPKYWGRKEIKRPIFEIVDKDWQPIWSVTMTNTGAITVERFIYHHATEDVTVPVVEYYDNIAASSEDWGKFAISIDRREINSNYNGLPGLGLSSPKRSADGYRLLLGCNVAGVSFNGYLREITVFDRAVSPAELEFVTGEIIHE